MNEHPSNEAATTLADVDAERELLGALLVDNGIADRVSVRPSDFFDTSHGDLWKAAITIIERGERVSVGVLAAAFPRLKAYVARLPDLAAHGTGAEERARTVRGFAARRRLVEMADELRERAGDTSVSAEEIMADVSGKLATIPIGREPSTKRRVAELVLDGLKRTPEVSSTGLAGIDKAMGGGLMAGKLYGIGARKKVGKTLLLGTISHNLNMARVPHLFIAAEMSSQQIEQRNIAREQRFNAIKFLTRDLGDLDTRVADYAATVPNFTLYEHAPGVTFNALRGIIGRARLKGIRGIILDYLQLVGGKAKSDSEEYHHRQVAQWLADTAVGTGLFVLTACQLNQDGNTRGGEGLKLACDQYFVLHRPKDEPGAWLEMEESRYTIYQNVGDESRAGLWLRKHGPHFSEDPPPLSDLPSSGAAA